MILSFIEMGDFSQKLNNTDPESLYCSISLGSKSCIRILDHSIRLFTRMWSDVECLDIHN